MGIFDSYSFWIVQGLCLISTVLMVMRMQQSDRRQFNLYHTYLCIPAAIAFAIQGAWVVCLLCTIGAMRTFLISTSWGDLHRRVIVLSCLFVAITLGASVAEGFFDWLLLAATIWTVSSEALKSFLNLRIANMMGCIAWGISSFLAGAYVNVFAQIFALISNVMATERDFMLSKRFKAAVFNCADSRAAYLARAA